MGDLHGCPPNIKQGWKQNIIENFHSLTIRTEPLAKKTGLKDKNIGNTHQKKTENKPKLTNH